jgi:protein-tyrosine phosphatase
MISNDKPSILMICMGNICRSPIVESVARVEFARAGLNATIASAGTENYHVGERADPRAIEIAEAHGYPLSAHRARQVRPADFDDYALILAMDRVNLDALAQRRPRGSASRPALFLQHAGFEGIDEVPAISSACSISRGAAARY